MRVMIGIFATTALLAQTDRIAELVSSLQQHESQHEYAQAIADYDQLLKLKPRWADGYNRRGAEHFKMAHIQESLKDFDRAIALDPAQAPYNWQRGISLYYAGRYEEGRKQFELHQTVNGNDVENAAWRYLCMARAGTVASARASILPIQQDSRVPMMQIYALYRGNASVEAVLEAARAGDPPADALRERLFYAHLYVGLYYEAAGDARAALEYIAKAAAGGVDHYMGDVARVHVQLLRDEKAVHGRASR
jgi:lipoprotein NlpI